MAPLPIFIKEDWLALLEVRRSVVDRARARNASDKELFELAKNLCDFLVSIIFHYFQKGVFIHFRV